MKRADVVFSGMRPTGRLHLGNYWGALKNWVSLQTQYSCFFSVVDWHMLTTGYDDTSKLQENCREMVLDWLAAGLDPAKCVIFKQSDVPEHAELALMLSMVTPLGWLENNPTWKEQLQELAKTKESQLRAQVDPRRKVFEQLLLDATVLAAVGGNNSGRSLLEDIGGDISISRGSAAKIPMQRFALWAQNRVSQSPLLTQEVGSAMQRILHAQDEHPNFQTTIDELEEISDDIGRESYANFLRALIVLDEKFPDFDIADALKQTLHVLNERFSDFDRIGIDEIAGWILEEIRSSRELADYPIRLPQDVRSFFENVDIGNGWDVSVGCFRKLVKTISKTSGADQSLRTYGFLGYPVLQAADILLYHGTKVPVGQDQLPHVELSREIARKFNHVFGEIFAEPQPLLTPTPKVPGLDSRKMSKSYGNAIDIYETEKSLEKKIKAAYTDPNRKTATDPGHPLPCVENPPGCSVYALHKLYADTDFYMKRGDECRAGALGCGACKKDLLAEMSAPFSEFRQRRESFTSAQVDAILMQGAEKARAVAKTTMVEVRRAMRLR